MKLLELTSKVHSKRPDVVVATGTELMEGDLPHIMGYKTMVPKVSSSTQVQTLMSIRKELNAEQLETPLTDSNNVRSVLLKLLFRS